MTAASARWSVVAASTSRATVTGSNRRHTDVPSACLTMAPLLAMKSTGRARRSATGRAKVKGAAADERDLDPAVERRCDRPAVVVRDAALAVEQGTVDVERQQTDGHGRRSVSVPRR